MSKTQLINMMASRANVPVAAAADELDRIVTSILRELRKGQPVALPGFGVLQKAANSGIVFLPEASAKPPRKR